MEIIGTALYAAACLVVICACLWPLIHEGGEE